MALEWDDQDVRRLKRELGLSSDVEAREALRIVRCESDGDVVEVPPRRGFWRWLRDVFRRGGVDRLSGGA